MIPPLTSLDSLPPVQRAQTVMIYFSGTVSEESFISKPSNQSPAPEFPSPSLIPTIERIQQVSYGIFRYERS